MAVFMDFVLDELVCHGGASKFGPELLGAGNSMKALIGEIRKYLVKVPEDGRRVMLNTLDVFYRCCSAARVAPTPKHHLLGHLIHRTRRGLGWTHVFSRLVLGAVFG